MLQKGRGKGTGTRTVAFVSTIFVFFVSFVDKPVPAQQVTWISVALRSFERL
jgi:hypothetical protein